MNFQFIYSYITILMNRNTHILTDFNMMITNCNTKYAILYKKIRINE
jgi:hypothetical protein